jgi:hypothetical protein
MRRPAAHIALVIAILGAATGTTYAVLKHPPATAKTDVPNIEEALFRHMAQKPQRDIHGLSIDGNDPDPAFMRRFRDMGSMKPGSQIGNFSKATGGWVDKKTGMFADGFFIDTKSITWTGPNYVSLDASAHASGLDGHEGVYTLRRSGSRWVVVSYKDSGIMF